MMRRYETVYIFDSALEEPAITEKLDKFHALLTKDGKGTLTNVAHWGKRTLAFPIKKRDSCPSTSGPSSSTRRCSAISWSSLRVCRPSRRPPRSSPP